MLAEYLIKKGLDLSLEAVKRMLKKIGGELNSTQDDLEEAITHHLTAVESWSSEISFNDLKESKSTVNVFIELDLYVFPRKKRIQIDEDIENIPLSNIFDHQSKHVILLGHPGAGKTTSMKYLCRSLFQDDLLQSYSFSFPLLIKLRELNDPGKDAPGIINEIIKTLDLKIDLPEKLLGNSSADARGDIKEKIVVKALESLEVLLILDGFDELIGHTQRKQIIQELTNLALQLKRSRFIITSRTGDFVYHIENSVQYEICPLKKEQISKFAIRWLQDEKTANDFLEKIYVSPFADTAIRPLTLAHLCALFERMGKIPDKPKTVYRKIVNLLLEEWDQQRSVKRESGYAHFEVDRKFEFLCNLAFILTVSLKKSVFDRADLLSAYRKIRTNFDLKERDANHVVEEIETHTGLFLQSGFEQFEFAHKSLQEFLTAEYLVKLPSIPSGVKILSSIPNELAIAVAISSSPSDYFSELIGSKLQHHMLPEGFITAFIGRLLTEKPDFNHSPKVGLSLLTLYSLYIQRNELTSTQQRLFYFDDITREFEALLVAIIRRNSLFKLKLNEFYKRDQVIKTSDENSIIRLVKVGVAGSHKSQAVVDSMPEVLYARESFFKLLEVVECPDS